MSKYKEFDNSVLKKYRVADRQSKINISDFAKIVNVNMHTFLQCLPDIQKGKDFKDFMLSIKTAISKKKPIILGIGGHVIKTGMSPLLIEIMRLGGIQGICCNGSVVIHDFEVSCFGKTSEDVAEALRDGSFGMATDTCDTINQIVCQGSQEQLGYGEAIGKYFCEHAPDLAHPELSIFQNAYELDIPVTVHVAIGTDINHQHETADGKAIGDCSMRDFRIFTNLVSQLDDGGVFINFGSAVIIPEVFLKAVTVCRNVTGKPHKFTTAVFDMNYHYRPQTNIVERPVMNEGNGYYFIGHHEIMIPLVLACMREIITER